MRGAASLSVFASWVYNKPLMTWQILPMGVMAMGMSGETAKGKFDVKLVPLERAAIGRMSIDKTFVGDLAATSVEGAPS